MKRAFLFDMDGVIVNSEQIWEKYGRKFQENVFGKEIVQKVGDVTGLTLKRMHDLAVSFGFMKSLGEVSREYDVFMENIYDKTTVTPGLEEFLHFLKNKKFSVGIVSSSRKQWIDLALRKVLYKNLFDSILSLDEKGFPSKPDPTGYIFAMKEIGSVPASTIVLEDSNAGIESAKASGAFTIAFTGLLVEGYEQISADVSAADFKEVEKIVEKQLTL